MDKKDYSSFGWVESVTPDDIINTAINMGIENIVNTTSIARVTAVNKNTVDVELLTGEKVINVLVCATAFNGWTLSLPIKEKDTGIVIFMKYEISDYKLTGEFKAEKLSLFSQNNGVFIPLALFTQPTITDDIVMTNNNVNITINKNNEINIKTNEKVTINAKNIELGENASESLVLGNTFLSEMNEIISMLKTHTHGTNGGGPIVASPDLATALNPLQNNILSKVSKTK